MQRDNNLIPFSKEYLPGVFALKNNGVLCYLNTMVQSLMSCPSLNYCLKKSKGTSIKEENKLALSYLNLFEKYAFNPEIKTTIKTDDASGILMIINRARKNKKDNLLIGRQEDIHEGVTLFLDLVKNGTENLFYIRNTCEIYCRNCSDRHYVEHNEAPELMIDLSEEDPLIQDNLQSKSDIEKYIKGNIQIPRDYKCDKCSSGNLYDKSTGDITPNVLQIYSLVRLSEIIVLLFKKYNQKTSRYFPPTLEFKSKSDSLLKYSIVAQVEHRGEMTGGHYVCKCLRNKPPGMHETRRGKARIAITKNEKRLQNSQISENDKQRIESEIAKQENNITEDEILEKEQLGVFLFNDGKVAFCPEGFVPTSDTYMVFYHLSSDLSV